MYDIKFTPANNELSSCSIPSFAAAYYKHMLTWFCHPSNWPPLLILSLLQKGADPMTEAFIKPLEPDFPAF